MSDISSILQQAESLSLFELHRLKSAMVRMLEDPQRVARAKCQLRIGMRITYFCCNTNQMLPATITEIHRSTVSIIDHQDGRPYRLYICCIQLDETIDPYPPTAHQRLDRNSLKVGDHVGWHSKLGGEAYGVVEKLNSKSASIKLANGARWRVAYSLLFPVVDCAVREGYQTAYIDHQ